MKLSELLKNSTAEAHQQLEKILAGRLKSMQAVDDYSSILAAFTGFIEPLEQLVNENLDINLLPDYHTRRKSSELKADLANLNFQGILSQCTDLPDISNTWQAFGALYVLEGSTLGGQIIRAMIIKKFPGIADNALSFFSSYRDDIGIMWVRFREAIDGNIPATSHNQVILAANETFLKFKNWLV